MKKIIEFFKEYTFKDFLTDLKFFGGIILFLFGSWFSYCVLYYIFK